MALGAVGLVLAAASARADVKVVKGGALRGGALTALRDAERAMIVCWRGSPPPAVRVALTVDASGAVTASPVAGGAAGQCAAGVLAVFAVPGGAWQGEVEIGSRVGAGDLAGAISRQLAARGDTIRACQAVAPKARGPAVIRMQVHPEGELTDVAVTSKLGAAIDRCIKTAVGGLRLDPLAAEEPVAYQLSLTFSGATAAAPTGPGPGTVVEGGDVGEAGSVSGALAAADVQRVLGSAQGAIARCLKAGKGASRMVVRFTVRADGTTKNVVIKEATGAPADEACVKKVLGGLTFTRASDETKVVYPLVLR